MECLVADEIGDGCSCRLFAIRQADGQRHAVIIVDIFEVRLSCSVAM